MEPLSVLCLDVANYAISAYFKLQSVERGFLTWMILVKNWNLILILTCWLHSNILPQDVLYVVPYNVRK